MLISCKYCGKWHDRKVVCDKKPKKKVYAKRSTYESRFRSSIEWTNKAIEIKKRDKYLCQICIRLLYDTELQYNYNQLEVHHIFKILNGWNYRLNNYYLITVCNKHHRLCDDGTIPIDELIQIAKIQEDNNIISQ